MFSATLSCITSSVLVVIILLTNKLEATNLLPQSIGANDKPGAANNQSWLPAKNEGGKFTLRVGAGEEFCFAEYFDLSTLRLLTYKVDFRVLKGGRVKDIDFYVKNPTGSSRISLKKKSKFSDVIEVSEGEWQFCLDNKFSQMSAKVVYFSLQSTQTESLQMQAKAGKPTVLTREEATLEQINVNMHEVQAFQNSARLSAATDWYHVQNMNHRVSTWSLGEVLLMTISPVAQVAFVRNLFRVHMQRYRRKPVA